MTEPRAAFPRHIYSLDALRGLAALGVVLWHWQHFFYGGPRPEGFVVERQPFFGAFALLYTDGWRAVDLFFCLSGFIFYWLYSDKIASGAVSLREFFLLRFSRLYPLHLATLLFVAVGQVLFLRVCRQSFVYQWNTLSQFVQQLGLANSWTPTGRITFNGPVWSVSVEVLLYGIFFVLCAVGWRRWWQLVPLVLAGVLTHRFGSLAVGRGLLSFFAGALTYQFCVVLARRGVARGVLWGMVVATALLWLGVKFLLQPGLAVAAYEASPLYLPWTWHGRNVAGGVLKNLVRYSPELLLYPLTILTLALWEIRRRLPVGGLAFLGQISYSSYLLHFPLQMVFIAATRGLGLPTSFYYSPWSLALFYATLVPLSLVCFRRFELPCQAWLRARLLPAREGRR